LPITVKSTVLSAPAPPRGELTARLRVAVLPAGAVPAALYSRSVLICQGAPDTRHRVSPPRLRAVRRCRRLAPSARLPATRSRRGWVATVTRIVADFRRLG
jgi:hypothetical protein